MEVSAIETFLKITGPWGLLGILIAFMWDAFRRNEKSMREILTAQTAILVQVTQGLATMESRTEAIEKSLNELIVQLKMLVRIEGSQ